MTTTKSSNISRISEAYNTGYEAGKKREPRSANPYAMGTIEAANWLAGWLAGR